MYYVGIDWADQKHDVCILADTGQIIQEFQISHTLKGFQTLSATLVRLADVKINIERSDGLLVDWLVRQSWPIYLTPTVVTHHRRPRRTKDDPGDAFLLAHLLRLGDPECRPLTQRGQLVEHLRQLLLAYNGMLREQRRLGNRLIYQLKQYYPAALHTFSQPYNLVALAFLEQYPTPEAAQQATTEELHDFLIAHHYGGKKVDVKLAELQRVLHTPAPKATVPDGLVTHVQLLIPVLRSVCQGRNTLERDVLALFPTHPDAAWWTSFPGSDRLTAARLLAWIGDDRRRFPTPEMLQAVAGTVPVTRRSGKSRTVEFRTACSHPLRKAVDDLARQSVRDSSWAKAYFDSQIDRGHAVARSYRALANRWLSIIWKLWQTGEPYDESVHIDNRARKGQRSKVVSAPLN